MSDILLCSLGLGFRVYNLELRLFVCALWKILRTSLALPPTLSLNPENKHPIAHYRVASNPKQAPWVEVPSFNN